MKNLSPKTLSKNSTDINCVSQNKSNSAQKGFTLVEIMIVLVILGGLFALIGPNIFGQADRAKVSMAKIQVSKLASAVELFYNDCDQYPVDLSQLIQKPSEDVCENWQPKGYVKNQKDLQDPWKREFVYEVEGGGFIIRSMGKDGQPGGAEFDKDISSEDL